MTYVHADTITCTFTTSSDGLSTAVDLKAYELLGLVMPTTWATANITFKASNTLTGTYYDLYDDAGNEVTVTSPANLRTVSLDSIALKLAPWRFIKARSGTTATPVAQSTNVTITFVVKA